MTDNQKTFRGIIEQLSAFSLEDQVDIIANVTMFTGASRIDCNEKITKDNIAKIIMQDRERNGETLINALALQGLTMVLWLQD